MEKLQKNRLYFDDDIEVERERAPPLNSLWVSASNAFRKLGCTHSQFSEVLGYNLDPEKPGVPINFFRIFSHSFQINAGILILCRYNDSEKAVPFTSTSLLFYFEEKLCQGKSSL